jgi:Spy/CpxP family protein refolding chaperone
MMQRISLIAILYLTGSAHAQVPPAERQQPAVSAQKAPPLALGGPLGVWWRDPKLAQRIGLSSDQQKSIESIWRDNRTRLANLITVLDNEQTEMASLLKAEKPDESKITTQIDRVVQARAELERANAHMLLEIRMVMPLDEWERLQRERPSVFTALLPMAPARPAPPALPARPSPPARANAPAIGR